MDTIPYDLDESARIDGASHTKIFIDIILPLSKPMIAVAAMNGFTGPLGGFRHFLDDIKEDGGVYVTDRTL